MATIRQVAQEAGCSIATVSRVLSGDSNFKVSDETRKRINDAVTKLDYRIPLRKQNRIKVSVILSLTAEKYSDPFFTDILTSIEKECERLNISISTIKSYNELSNPATLQEFLNTEMDGVIFMEQIPDNILIQIKKHVPHILFIDNDEDDYHYNGVGFDHRVANKQAMNCLIKYGYRRIAIISGSSPNEPLEDTIRMSTYRNSLRKIGVEYDEQLVKDCEWDLDTCAEQTRELMNLPIPPEAIFAGSDSLASTILGTLYNMGYKVPDDIGIIGFNDLDMCNYTIPPLTTIKIPTDEIGTAAVQRLKEMIEGSTSKRKILLPTKVVVRDSLKKI